METKELKVRIKSIYGQDRVYPACDNSTLFACIAGTKTFSVDQIRYIKQLGYKFTVEGHTKV